MFLRRQNYPIFEEGTLVYYIPGFSVRRYGRVINANTFAQMADSSQLPLKMRAYDRRELVCVLESSGNVEVFHAAELTKVRDPLKFIEELREAKARTPARRQEILDDIALLERSSGNMSYH